MKTFIYIVSAAYMLFVFWIAVLFYSYITYDDSQYFRIDPAIEHNKKITKDIKQI